MSWEDEIETTEEAPSKRRFAAEWLLPFAAAGVSLGCGLVVGLAAGFAFGVTRLPSAEVAAEVVTADDIAFASVCAPIQEEAETRIGTLNTKIDGLEVDIRDRRAKVAELEDEMQRRADAGKKVWKELQQAREQLAVAMQAKEALEIEKADLILTLTRTEQRLAKTELALDDQVELTEHYRFESLDHNFDRFVNESQLAICERGNRKKLGNCREVVTSLLVASDVQTAFRHCVRSGQEAPIVREVAKDERIPEFSRFLDQDDRIVRDWYVHLCDPTLPEADTLVADAVVDLRDDS